MTLWSFWFLGNEYRVCQANTSWLDSTWFQQTTVTRRFLRPPHQCHRTNLLTGIESSFCSIAFKFGLHILFFLSDSSSKIDKVHVSCLVWQRGSPSLSQPHPAPASELPAIPEDVPGKDKIMRKTATHSSSLCGDLEHVKTPHFGWLCGDLEYRKTYHSTLHYSIRHKVSLVWQLSMWYL